MHCRDPLKLSQVYECTSRMPAKAKTSSLLSNGAVHRHSSGYLQKSDADCALFICTNHNG